MSKPHVVIDRLPNKVPVGVLPEIHAGIANAYKNIGELRRLITEISVKFVPVRMRGRMVTQAEFKFHFENLAGQKAEHFVFHSHISNEKRFPTRDEITEYFIDAIPIVLARHLKRGRKLLKHDQVPVYRELLRGHRVRLVSF